jgi:hypothetical protein
MHHRPRTDRDHGERCRSRLQGGSVRKELETGMRWLIAGLWAAVPVILAIAVIMGSLPQGSHAVVLVLGIGLAAGVFTWHLLNLR